MPTPFQNSAALRNRRRRNAKRRGRDPLHSPKPFPVFIAYADVAAARRAMNHISATLEAINSNSQIQPMLWRFDQLDESQWREMALRDAADAAAVVIALSDELPFHSAAEMWLTTLATRHPGSSINVLAVWNEEFWSISLQQMAHANTGHEPTAVHAVESNSPKLVGVSSQNLAACGA